VQIDISVEDNAKDLQKNWFDIPVKDNIHYNNSI
jgi:hypothetical protein